MTDKYSERVLVVPTTVFHQAGAFQGFHADADRYLAHLLQPQHLSYRPRSEVEADPGFKQLVPYVVLRWQDQVFHYRRGKQATETRLQALRSIGVGGHIRADDHSLFENPYRQAMHREVSEEIYLECAYEDHCLGLINDDSTLVGRVHLGIVHVFSLSEPRVRRREQGLVQSGFAPLTVLLEERSEFETWSQIVLDVLAGRGGDRP